MKTALNGNGNGNGHGAPAMLRQLEKKAASARPAASPATKESRVTFQTAEAVELAGAPVRVTRHLVVFELYNPAVTPRLSESLTEFKIILQGQTVYAGRATLRNVVDGGTRTVCEATLKESDWTDLKLISSGDGAIAREFKEFLNDWQKLYRVEPEFKVVLADMQTFLQDLRLWLERMELRIKLAPPGERPQQEAEIARQLEPAIVPAIRNFFEKFEELANKLSEDARAAHYAFGMRSIHSLLLSSPFVRRTFEKPLGYAGDYQMVDMMFRSPFEGETLFGKLINLYAMQLPPIIGHRNRITYLTEKLEKESLRVMVQGQDAKVFNLGCGPAREIQRFLADDELANYTHFTLADFDDETLAHAKNVLGELRQRHARRGKITVQKRSVYQILKQADKISQYTRADQYDLVYCAGLFDYLTDEACRQLVEIFYAMLLPGGLVIVTNVDDHPAKNQMECFLEWSLIHRDEKKMQSLIPRGVEHRQAVIKRDPSGVNIFLEIRKPSGEN